MEFVQWSSELRREPVALEDLVVSIKCGESDTTTGLASCPTVGQAVDRTIEAGAPVFSGETDATTGLASGPTVGQAVDRLIEAGSTVFFGETSELTGGEHLIAERMATPELRERFPSLYDDYATPLQDQTSDHPR